MHVGMDRSPKFTISGKLYAVAPDTFRRTDHGKGLIDAVWYRRKDRVTYASTGFLWDYNDATDWAAFLEVIDTRVYGPSPLARFGPDGLWTPQAVMGDETARLTGLLGPMLADIPSIPAGHDGWWMFR